MTDTRAVFQAELKGAGMFAKKVFGKPEVVEEEPFDGHFQFSKF